MRPCLFYFFRYILLVLKIPSSHVIEKMWVFRNYCFFFVVWGWHGMSDSPDGLQKKMLDTLYSYCNDWKLFVNVSKTKKVVFKKSGRLNQNVNWSFNDEEI